MFQCEIRGGTEFRQEQVEQVFHVDERYIPVEHIPATVRARRGGKTFDAETAEGIRRRLHDEDRPRQRAVEMAGPAY